MSERISSWENFKDNEKQQKEAATRIGKKALRIVDRQYGCGYPKWQSGKQELSYHNGHHARAVGKDALKVCVRMGLSSTEQTVAKTSGYAHDIIHRNKRGRDEQESAEWLDSELKKSNLFPESLRHAGRLAIIGTEPIFSGKQVIGQMASQLDYPDKNAELLAKAVACGDFGELYVPEGPYLAHQYFREIKGMPSEDDLPFEDIVDFQRGQVNLLHSYTYPHPTGEKTLATHKPQITAYAESVLHGLETGAIESWDKLLARDKAFIAKHR